MAPHDRGERTLKGTLTGLLLITLGAIFCSTISVVGMDLLCSSDIEKWQPIYPNAELVETIESGLFRPRAMGITQQVYYTPDDRTTVLGWYRDYRRMITEGVESGDRAARGIATTSRSVRENDDGEGSFIIQYSECAQS